VRRPYGTYRACALFGMAVLLSPIGGAALAASPPASASGSVSSTDGALIGGAAVTLSGNGPQRSARSDRRGAFSFPSLTPGTYTLAVTAPGYNPIDGRLVEVAANANTVFDLRLPRLQASSLTVIGSVRANGAQTISTLPAPTLDISMQPYAQQGETRVSDILANQLSTTVVPVLGGGLNAPMVVSLRVAPIRAKRSSTSTGTRSTTVHRRLRSLVARSGRLAKRSQVVYGIAPSSLFGPNTLGGALNVRTLEPTRKRTCSNA
jgi:hypothetical protein